MDLPDYQTGFIALTLNQLRTPDLDGDAKLEDWS
jgi:hypothetical protein